MTWEREFAKCITSAVQFSHFLFSRDSLKVSNLRIHVLLEKNKIFCYFFKDFKVLHLLSVMNTAEIVYCDEDIFSIETIIFFT